MKEKDKINFLSLLKKHIFYKDGFWVYKEDSYSDPSVISEDMVRQFIHLQGIPILEKDITDLLSELSYNQSDLDIDEYFRKSIKARAGCGKSKYFASMDELYPGNKLREIMNYYLFSDECYSFILVGYGQTGKTTFVSLISQIIDSAFFGRSNVALLKNSHGTAILEGKLFFEVAEAQDLDLDTANMLKSIITNDDIYINPKFQLPRKIKPHNKLIMTCNNMPRFKVTDDGIIRRFITIEMNNKIQKQNKNFIKEMMDDIPNIIKEALDHPFDIKDFAKEQYTIFENDPQWGFGYGEPNYTFEGETAYEKYQTMCRALGYNARNKHNFDKFVELAKIYGERICDTTSKGYQEQSGLRPLSPYEIDDLPF